MIYKSSRNWSCSNRYELSIIKSMKIKRLFTGISLFNHFSSQTQKLAQYKALLHSYWEWQELYFVTLLKKLYSCGGIKIELSELYFFLPKRALWICPLHPPRGQWGWCLQIWQRQAEENTKGRILDKWQCWQWHRRRATIAMWTILRQEIIAMFICNIKLRYERCFD